ncbi:MAG: TonB-dependent receptor [Pseudomonadota bacterium]
MRLNRSLLGLLGSASALAFPYTGAANAQQGEPGQQRLETIQVTAQKRVETLQEVPVALTAFDDGLIETLDIDGVADLAAYTPNLFTSASPIDPSDLRIAIRGIGNSDPQIGLDSKTAIYIDGVYVGKASGLNYDVANLERVEVLKGPQGTLYGRNAVAGAINLISRKASTTEPKTRLSAQYGEFNFYEVSGSSNRPLSEAWAIQFSGTFSARDGWVKNRRIGEDFHGYDRTAIGADVTYEPTDFLSVNYALDYAEANQQPPLFVPIGSAADGLFAAAVPAFGDTRREEATSTVAIEESATEVLTNTLTADWVYAPNHELKLIGAYRTADSSAFVSAYPELDLGIAAAVVNTPSPQLGGLSANALFSTALGQVVGLTGQTLNPDYLAQLSQPFVSFGTSITGEQNKTIDDHEQYSLEAIFTGSFNERFEYTGGLYYFNEDTGADEQAPQNDYFRYVTLLGLLAADGNLDGAPDFPAALTLLDQAAGLGCFTGSANPACAQLLPALEENAILTTQQVGDLRNNGARTIRLGTDAYAVFGQVTYEASDRMRVTAGARVSIDEKDGIQQGKQPFVGDNLNLLGQPIPQLRGSDTFTSFDPALVLEYDLTPAAMIYTSYKEGYRSGGFNSTAPSLESFRFDQEEISAVEAGLRSQTFDDRLRVNVNVYHHWLTDEQVLVQAPGNPLLRAISNTDSRYYGVEIDGAAIIVPGIRVDFSYAYAQTEQDDVFNPFTGAIEARDEIAIPENSATVAINYDQPLQFGTLESRLAYSYTQDTLYLPNTPADEQRLLEARIGLTFQRGEAQSYTVALWGRNLLDEEYNTVFADLNAVAQDIQAFGTPRTFGISLSAEF